MIGKRPDGAFFEERRDEVYLGNSRFSENICCEFKEIDKHEIVVKICEIIGSDPCNFALAEKIFEEIKFDMTHYVLHHEYCKENGIRSRLLLWLESKMNPATARRLNDFIDKYLK